MRLSAHRGGFSLLEVTLAVALLGLACVTVSGVLGAGLRAERAVDQRRHLDMLLDSEAERLAALPYFSRAAGADPPVSPTSLLGEVFPHALAERNEPDSFFADGSGHVPAGAFVSDLIIDGVTVRRVAQFATAAPDGVGRISAESLVGWAVWTQALPPAGLIEIELSARWRGLQADRHVVLGAARPVVAARSALGEGRFHVA